MYTGKSHDLHWARYVSFPSVEEYIDMMSKSMTCIPIKEPLASSISSVLTRDAETGGLFRMLSRLMCSKLDTEYVYPHSSWGAATFLSGR